MKKNDILMIISDKRSPALILIALMVMMNIASIAYAQGSEDVNEAACKLNIVFCNVAHLIFLVAGAIAALVIILAGLRWITAADDPGARNGAKTTIISAFVGLIIIMIAVYIVALVVNGMLPSEGISPSQWMMGCPSECSTT